MNGFKRCFRIGWAVLLLLLLGLGGCKLTYPYDKTDKDTGPIDSGKKEGLQIDLGQQDGLLDRGSTDGLPDKGSVDGLPDKGSVDGLPDKGSVDTGSKDSHMDSILPKESGSQ